MKSFNEHFSKASYTTAALSLILVVNALGQGQGSVIFSTIGVADSLRIKDGSGANASGPAYAVALYWGVAGETDDRNLQQIGALASLLTGANAGTYAGSVRTITTPGSTVNGPVLSFQVRAWASACGRSYEAALASGGPTGKNAIFQLKTKDETNPLETKPNIYSALGYQGIQIADGPVTCPGVPEPSVIILGILGAFLMLRCRRN